MRENRIAFALFALLHDFSLSSVLSNDSQSITYILPVLIHLLLT